MIGVWIAIAAVSILIILAFIKANLRICHPNEILVFSGKKRKLKDGTVVGYRYIKGGRGLKIPIVESVSRLPLTTIPIELELSGALTNGIIPINIQAWPTSRSPVVRKRDSPMLWRDSWGEI